ncbi:MAG: cobalamin B12-binding domain-containing protein [Proteobacteria bacterium]|nr:cobalamin B12-binding domain-containing protein [Pseudomonadota bacterium]MBI3497208.1 cobalamin B12-binding domain-containing protein [Pseudomonadota bacterium]
MVAIAFVDLTHTEQGIAANNFPLGIAYIAAATSKALGSQVECQIFKYPDILSDYLDKSTPTVAAFSYYMWNAELQLAYACAIKRRHPETVTVFGGPNFPIDPKEQEDWLRLHPEVDFYVDGEGEEAFIALLQALIDADFDAEQIKAQRRDLPNLRFLDTGRFVRLEMKPRTLALDEVLPSPYLMGLMDQFFDGKLTPMMQTSRGCPYSCTFCHDGIAYMSKTRRFSQARVDAELEYVFERVNVPNITLADLNWGMFPEDLETAATLARMKQEKQWPRLVGTATAKNQKQRVLEMAAKLGDSVIIGASIQSTDAEVLANIKRTNIGIDAIVAMAKQSKLTNSTSFTEIILGLPGDTKEKHIKSACDMMDAGIQDVNNYQFVLLPGTEAADQATRAKFRYERRFRVMPRCFGEYRIYGEAVPVFEVQETCVGNSTMSYEDYKDCRWWDLTLSIFNNGSTLDELYRLCALLGVKRSDLLLRMHVTATKPGSTLFQLYEDFRADDIRNLWPDLESLTKFLLSAEGREAYASGVYGANQIFKYRTLAVATMLDEVLEIASSAVEDALGRVIAKDHRISQYIVELCRVISALRSAPLEVDRVFTMDLHFDFVALSHQHFLVDPRALWTKEPRPVTIAHDEVQRRTIREYFTQYGASFDGLAHLIHRTTAQVLHRKFVHEHAPANQAPVLMAS